MRRATIALVSYGDIVAWGAIARELRERHEIDARFIASARAIVEHARTLGVDVALLDAAAEAPLADPDAALRARGVDDPKAFIFPDWAYARYRSRTELVAEAAALYPLVERELDAHPPDVILQYVGGESLRRILQREGDRRGIPNLWLGWTPIPGSMGIYRNEMCHWENLRIPEPDSLTAEQRHRAESYLVRFRARSERVPNVQMDTDMPRGTLGQKITAMRHEMRVSGWSVPRAARVFAQNRWIDASERVRRAYYRRRVYPTLARSQQEVARAGPFAFFPIQWWRESRTTVRAPIAIDIERAVLPVAAALPPGYRLLVKDHPLYVGALSRRTVRAISADPRVRWLAPEHNAHEIVRQADVVVVVNNTVGYEAILQGRRVVTLGNEFYCGLGLTVDAATVADVPQAIKAALDFEPDEDRILAFVHAVHEASYPGTWGVVADGNPEKVAESIATYMAREL